MYKQILVPTDGSKLSAAAIDQTLAFAREVGASVTFCTATAPAPVYGITSDQLAGGYEAFARIAREEGVRRLADAEARAAAAGVPCQTRMAESEQTWQAIIHAASEVGADLIAMASHGRRGLSAVVLGSETTKVLTHSTIPVLVFRQPPA